MAGRLPGALPQSGDKMPAAKSEKGLQRIEYVFCPGDRDKDKPFEVGDVVARYAVVEDGRVVDQSRLRPFATIPKDKQEHILTCGVVDEVADPDRDGKQFAKIVVVGEVIASVVGPGYKTAGAHMPNITFA